MSVDKVKKYFAGYGMESRVLEFDVSSATVELAAAALNCEPGRIAKTLSFLVGEQPILIVSAGDVKIDNAKYKATFGKKAKMLTPGAGNRTDRTCGGRRLPICHKSRRGYLLGCFPEKI